MRWSEFYTPDGFVNAWSPGSYAHDPTPYARCKWIEAYRLRISRATRIVCEWPRLYVPGPIDQDFEDERTTVKNPREQELREKDVYRNGNRQLIRWRKPLFAFCSLWETVEKPCQHGWDVFAVTRPYTWSYRFKYPQRAPVVPAHLVCPPEMPDAYTLRKLAKQYVAHAGPDDFIPLARQRLNQFPQLVCAQDMLRSMSHAILRTFTMRDQTSQCYNLTTPSCFFSAGNGGSFPLSASSKRHV